MTERGWSEKDLERLATLRRNGEITEGIVRSVGKRKMPVADENGRVTTQEVECAIFYLEGDVKAFCPAHEFSEHEFRSLVGFVGTTQKFIIKELILDNPDGENLAIVSVKEADKIRREKFWEQIKQLQQEGRLSEVTFEGVVTGYNPQTQRIFVKVEGTDCFMLSRDWDHDILRNLDEIERNTKVPVKVLRFDEERQMVQVSRRAAIPDPFVEILKYKDDDAVVGRVVNVHAVHGIFVQLDKGVVVKASKPSHLPAPIVDDIVSVRVREVNVEERKAKVVIIGYPQGKKKREDVGAFLYS